MSRAHLLLTLVPLFSACDNHAASSAQSSARAAPGPAPAGMVWIPSGTFTMGGSAGTGQPDELPAHRVRITGFWMDAHEVTNAEFRAFVEATGHVSTAEKPVDWEMLKTQVPPGTPKPPPEMLQPSSIVFVASDDPNVRFGSKAGASWRKPDGEHALGAESDTLPVVHVSWDDALAYAQWADKRLPTEAEWEYAARGGLDHQHYTWGDEFRPGGRWMANLWQGAFPMKNTKEDGFVKLAPVGTFPANGYGLSDMAGNVWEWCADYYRPDAYANTPHDALDPRGPDSSYDPEEPTAPKRLQRGGSFLCADSYCIGYRPAARNKSTPDSSFEHTGFRCVRTP